MYFVIPGTITREAIQREYQLKAQPIKTNTEKQSNQTKKANRKEEQKHKGDKINNKMTELNPNTAVITIKENGC